MEELRSNEWVYSIVVFFLILMMFLLDFKKKG